MKRLYFVRHGQSVMNSQGLYAGHTDTPLTDEGRRQAKAAGHQAKNEDIDLIICSPLSRTRETATIIAHEIGYPEKNIELLPELIERNMGVLEGKRWSPQASKVNNTLGRILEVEGAEQIDELLERAAKVIERSKNHPSKAKNILLVGHGGIGRALRFHAVTESDYHQAFPNAELVRWI